MNPNLLDLELPDDSPNCGEPEVAQTVLIEWRM